MNYSDYKNSQRELIAETIKTMRSQPVLFLGSGISRRYFDAPNWAGLLQILANDCPLIDKEYAYYAQSCSSEIEIGSIFAEAYKEWAWTTGKNNFPKELFNASVQPDQFIKYAICQYLISKTPKDLDGIDLQFSNELLAIQAIKPHAVLTTNYDDFIELLFPDYGVVVGEDALQGMPYNVGEIFKFHGSVHNREQIVLTTQDFDQFTKKKKFIAARLLSLFNEHPMLIVGYGANDPDVRELLADIDQALGLPGSLIANIYFLEFDNNAEAKTSFQTEKIIQIEENRSVRVRLINASNFEWVFNAFKSQDNLHSIPVKVMRAIMARSYEFIRSDIPRTQLDVDFQMLEQKLESNEEFGKVFGITTINAASLDTALYPYSLTELGKELGGSRWHTAQKVLDIIQRDTGFDLKKTDNRYQRTRRRNTSYFHEYTHEALTLLKRVQKSGKCELSWLDTTNLQR